MTGPCVAGVDACRGGWIAVVLDNGAFASSLFARSFDRLLAELDNALTVGVDIPIGLPTVSGRAADTAARAFVGARRNSVFPRPPKVALEAATYAEARATVPSLSAQSFALRGKILEVEAALSDKRVFEVHPEVSFVALAGGRHLRHSKRTWNGLTERRRLLVAAGIELPHEIAADQAAPDDVVDAAAAAWSAQRKALGQAQTLPPEAPTQDGRVVAIWY